MAQEVQSLLLVLVTRPLADPLPREYGQLVADPVTERLSLSPLSPEDSLALVGQRLGVEQLPEPVAALLRARAQGNPFFLEELGVGRLRQGSGVAEGVQVPHHTVQLCVCHVLPRERRRHWYSAGRGRSLLSLRGTGCRRPSFRQEDGPLPSSRCRASQRRGHTRSSGPGCASGSLQAWPDATPGQAVSAHARSGSRPGKSFLQGGPNGLPRVIVQVTR